MNQVFMNLLVNAIDALEESLVNGSITDKPTIRIRTSIQDDNQVVISIADNGPGMNEATRKQLFDPFFTTKPIGKGTGMIN
jgi:signal transduction histidine kinase